MAKSVPHSRHAPERDGDQFETVSLDGERRLAYTEYGRPDGVPVVFLHGTPGSRRLGELFETAAGEAGVRLVAPDRPGYGRSTPWPARTIRDAGTVVGAVLDDADVERAGLVGFSGGGPHALAAAATLGDRISRVDVVAGATPPAVSEETPAVQRLLAGLAGSAPALLGGLLRGQAWIADRLAPSFVVAQYTDDTTDVPGAVPETVAADFVEALARYQQGAVTEFRDAATDWEIRFDEIGATVCLWHGEDDSNVPVGDARRLARQIPTADLRLLDGADHLHALLEGVPRALEEH